MSSGATKRRRFLTLRLAAALARFSTRSSCGCVFVFASLNTHQTVLNKIEYNLMQNNEFSAQNATIVSRAREGNKMFMAIGLF